VKKVGVTKAQIAALAESTADAYSADSYASWSAVAGALLRRGYTAAQAESIMRSKLTRWAADQANSRDGRATANDLLRFLDRCPDEVPSLLREEGLAS
jgi:hypothetical protein